MLAGLVSGYFAWGEFNALNYQGELKEMEVGRLSGQQTLISSCHSLRFLHFILVLLYVASRSLVGLWKRFHDGPRPTDGTTGGDRQISLLDHPVAYRILSGLVWGLAMILFEESPHVLHASMRKSMEEIYRFQLG